MRVYLIFLHLFIIGISYGQQHREDVLLGGNEFTIYMGQVHNDTIRAEVYKIPNGVKDTIVHYARLKDLRIDKNIMNGIYRIKDDAIHLLEIDMKSESPKFNYFIYGLGEDNLLTLTQEELNLSQYPKNFPPKFAENKSLTPEYPGGDEALFDWADKHILPVLSKDSNLAKGTELKIILEIGNDGIATLSDVKPYHLVSDNAMDEIINSLEKMPVWKTTFQGYKVSGIVVIPLTVE